MREKLFVVATVVANPGKEDLLREALLALAAVAKTETGFIQYDLHESLEKPGHFVFYEAWEDQRSLDLHSNSDAIKAHVAKAGGWTKSVSMETYRRIS